MVISKNEGIKGASGISDVAFPEKYYSEKYLPLIFISYRIILRMLLAHLGDYKCY